MGKILTPNITWFDIETSPNIGTFWRSGYKVRVSTDDIWQERVILMAAWKHKGDDNVYYTDALKINEDGSLDDSQVCTDIARGLKDTELLVMHNGDKFDLPWVNGRCLKHGVPRVAPVRTLDTLKVAKKQFNLNGYRLDYLGEYLGLGNKIKTDFSLWRRVMAGDKKAFKEMLAYNIRDVELLEDIYNKIEPYNDSPVVSNEIADASDPCPHCGSYHKQSRGRYLNLKTYRLRYQCMGCGKFLKSGLIKK